LPSIVRAFIVGAQYGDGAIRKNNQTVGYYNTIAASYGLQAGVQTFGYALFFMTDAALAYLHSSDGWEIGVGRVLSSWRGTARTLTTSATEVVRIYRPLPEPAEVKSRASNAAKT
jgi:lipid-binding SYLF domain-containing protein